MLYYYYYMVAYSSNSDSVRSLYFTNV